MMIIKSFYQLLQREDLTVVRLDTIQAVPHSLQLLLSLKSLLDQVYVRRMTAAFAQRFYALRLDQRAVHINRNIPAKCRRQTIVFSGEDDR